MVLPDEGAAPAGDVERLIPAARDGSSEAMGQLLELCRQYLLLVADREMEADLQARVAPSDVVQDTFLEAQRDFGQFRGSTEGEVLAWLRHALLHNVANWRRHFGAQKRNPGTVVPLGDVVGGQVHNEPAASGPSPSSALAAQEQDEGLQRALAQLPEDYREVLRLYYQERCRWAEIGRRMNRSADAARKLWARAVEELDSNLKSSHDTP